MILKSKNKNTLYFLIYLLVLPISFSITLEELIDSYDYSYESNTVNISSINHYGLDVNGSSLYDLLVINITIRNEEGNYGIIGDLYNDKRFIQSYEKRSYLNQGENQVELNFSPKLMEDGTYDLSLTINKDFLIEHRNRNAYSFDFSNEDYEKPDINVNFIGHQLTDLDADPEYELLEINLSIDSTLTDVLEIAAYLTGNNKTIVSGDNYTIQNGTNYITAKFNSTEIRKDRIHDARLYSVEVKDGIMYSFPFNETIAYTLTELDPGTSMFADSYSDSLVDLDADERAEYLKIELGLDIVENSDYTIEGQLYDLYNNYITSINQTFSITNVGVQIVDLKIDGTNIYVSKLNGPYLLNYLRLTKNNRVLDSVLEPYTTDNYTYEHFEKPNLPDLIITKVSLDNGNVKSEIKNDGNAHAFGIIVNYFDHDFNVIEQKIVSYLAPDSTKTFNFTLNTSNISKLYAIVDYDNDIEESNESNNLFTYERKSFDILLNEGWNLISIPLELKNKKISSVFSSVNFSSIFAYDGSWLYYYNETNNNFNEINETKGYWINSLNNQTLRIEGLEFSSISIILKQGWNLIGYPSLDTNLINETLGDIDYSHVYSYNNSRWYSYNQNKPSLLRYCLLFVS